MQTYQIRAQPSASRILNRCLSWLRLLLSLDDWHKRDVDLEKVVLSCPASQLAHRLNEGRALNISHGPAQLNDAHIRCLVRIVDRNACDALNPVLDRVRKVGDDLHRTSEVVTATLTLNDVLIDLARRDVVLARQRDVEVALVVSKIEIDLTAIVQNEDFTVSGENDQLDSCLPVKHGFNLLGGCHGSGINVHVRIDLNARDLEANSLEQQPGGRGCTKRNQPAIPSHHSRKCAMKLTNDALSNAGDDSYKHYVSKVLVLKSLQVVQWPLPDSPLMTPPRLLKSQQ
jgi:hypothetical protein